MEPPRPDEGPRTAPGRPRRRTLPLLAGAAALGVIAGACVGYLVQADRAPTPLAPLSQPVVPTAPRGDTAPADPAARTDGDLRALLLPAPRGARDLRGWSPLGRQLALYGIPAGRLSNLVDHDFRRTAQATWRTGSRGVKIQLDQYRTGPEHHLPRVVDAMSYQAAGESGTPGTALPGSSNGMVFTHTTPEQVDGRPMYLGQAHAWRGDVVVRVIITGTTPIAEQEISELTRRQVARL
ncbi:hypothetical protein ACFWIA_14305 [Streptomyces sp. NPDC127068]|uniref:hypothetical protein n=1 Tax=Streptomyces sp. NPDC127068 TaxID=3347127 RepID=UPI0036598E41